ncbi:MAG: sigma-70 family RNA polymerase sigma factor [Chloroflexota bacterium]|nr:sigma-70 family RNA polymerase sigma factor [Chloroflexota bacterium]
MNESTDRPADRAGKGVTRQTIADTSLDSALTPESELHLIELLRKGDESAFVMLVERYNRAMLRLAMIYVSKQAIAEEVVQETWMGVLQGLDRFERRSSLKTWIFRILANCAKTYALREGRSIPFSSLADVSEAAVDPDRFFPPDAQRPGAWISLPENWDEIPERRLLSQETYVCIESAIETLPPNQRTVIILHDVEGWTPEEIRSVLEVSEGNQRVLLHRARSKVRRALERYLDGKEKV